MTNNEIFIDTMDKINTIAKGKGFVNGLDWAKTAKDLKEISDLDFSTFENCHNLRNLMAHGSAKDISLSTETINQMVRFLSAIAMTRATPTPKAVADNPLDAEKFVQGGDIVFMPFFQGYTSVTKPPKPVSDFSSIYFTDFSEKIHKDHRVGGLISHIEKVDLGFRSFRLQAKCHPDRGGKSLPYPQKKEIPCALDYVPIIRPSTEVKVAIMSAQRPVYVTQYKLVDETFHLTLATTHGGSTLYDLLTGREELKLYSCRTLFVSTDILNGIEIRDGKPNYSGQLKHGASLFLSYPPQYGQPYYNEYFLWRREIDWNSSYSKNMTDLFGYAREEDLPF